MNAELVIRFPDGHTERVALQPNELFIGREPGLAVSLPDSKISRRHAKLTRRGEQWWLEDLGSVNGLLLDGLPLSGQALLSIGSEIEIGDFHLTLAQAQDLAPKPQANQPERWVGPHSKEQLGTQFALRVIDGELLGQSFVLNLQETLIGRGAEANLALEVPSISRRHALVRTRDDNSISVEDLGSSNGTFVGDLQVTEDRVIAVGEQVRFGTLVMQLERAGAAPTQRAAVKPQPAPQQPAAPTAPIGARKASPMPSNDTPSRPPAPGLTSQALSANILDDGEDSAGGQQGPKKPETDAAAKKDGAAQPQPVKPVARPSEKRRGKGQTVLRGARFSAWAKRRLIAAGVATLLVTSGGFLLYARRHKGAADQSGSLPANHAERLVPPQSATMWQVLRGFGASQAERDWLQRRDAQLAQASQALLLRNYDKAEQLLAQVLRLDPTLPEALALRANLYEATRRAQAYTQAVAHRAQRRFGQALLAANDALSLLPEQRSADDEEDAAELQQIVQQSTEAVAQACSDDARAACSQERYESCVAQTACALGYNADDETAQACLNLLASIVDPQGSALPGQTSNKDSDADKESSNDAPHIDARAGDALYADQNVRKAVLTYATGDLGLASLRLRNIDNAHSRAVLADLRALEAVRAQAQQEEAQKKWDAALGHYQEALMIDARLVPRDIPCGPRRALTDGAQRIFLLLGEQAYDRDAFAEALTIWQRGMALNKSNSALQAAFDKLGRRARAVMEEATGAARPPSGKKDEQASDRGKNHDPCKAFRDVMAMTQDDEALHQAAAAQLSACKRKQQGRQGH